MTRYYVCFKIESEYKNIFITEKGIIMKYKLDVKRDVDIDGGGFFNDITGYILNLPFGFRFYDDLVHVRGYDTMQELRESAKRDVIPCDCKECKENS